MKAENNRGRFSREEAKRTLDEVLQRHGIDQPDRPAHPLANTSSSAPKEPTQRQGRRAARLEPQGPPQQGRSVPPLELVLGPGMPGDRSLADNQTFHYLIRVAECALTLHCEVNAEDEAAARHRVERIPNLMEWRAISGEELAEILRDEKSSFQAG